MRRDFFRIFLIGAIAALATACGSGDIFTTAAPGTGGSGGGSTGSSSAAGLSLIANSAQLPSNATDPTSGLSGVTVTAIVTDANNGAVSGASVLFKADNPTGFTRTGTPVALIVGGSGTTDSSGIITATIYTGGNTALGTMQISATVNGITKALTITVVSPTQSGGGGIISASQLNLTVSNAQLASDAVNASDGVTITGILLDANNVAVPGVQATFATTRGQLIVSNSVSDSSGHVSAILTTGGDPTAGPITVTVTAPQTGSATALSKNTVITEVAGSSGSVVSDFSFLASSSTLNADASTSGAGVTLTVTALDANHNIIQNVNVAFTSDKGAIQVVNGTTDTSGQAKAILTTGGDSSLGPINVNATIGSTTKSLVIQEIAASTPDVQIGVLNGGTFTLGSIAVGAPSISAGGSSSLTVDIVDTNSNNAPLVGTNVTLTFSSACAASGLATINGSPITTASGQASVTYVDKGCGGTGGATDNIFVTGSAGGHNVSAQGSITVAATSIGSLQFVSATPTIIGLKGSGQPENSVVVFKLVNASGGPVVGQAVDFSLSTTVGGITLGTSGLTTDSSITDSSGLVQTQVNSGSVHTSVRVIATATQGSNTFTTQSGKLVISSGNADQNSFSLSTSCFNIEGGNIDGTTATITIRAADHFNNPVPDGTAVAFTTEGGAIVDSCETTDGSCSVTWTSQDPRTIDYGTASDNSERAGRSTVLATALGEESFTDINGDGLFEDGEPFGDLPEAFLDVDESGTRTAATPEEEFLDFDKDNAYDGADGKYNGTLCAAGQTQCGTGVATSLHVRDSVTLIMSGSSPVLDTSDVSAFPGGAFNGTQTFTVTAANTGTSTPAGTIFAQFVVRDSNDEPMPAGTTIALEANGNGGSITGASSYSVPCQTDDSAAGNTYAFAVTGPSTPGTGTLTLTVTSPSGVKTIYQFLLNAV